MFPPPTCKIKYVNRRVHVDMQHYYVCMQLVIFSMQLIYVDTQHSCGVTQQK